LVDGGFTKLEFGHALGDIGLQWEDTIVTHVGGQAKQKGVRPGWKIYMVDGCPVSNSEEIWGRFQEAKWQWRNCSVHFVTDIMAIRADASRARVAKMQAETERLARLPFEGSHDTRHLEQLKEEFKFQGYVESPEHRAVSLAQLKHLLGWAASHCHRWRDPKTRSKLHIDVMNLYQINHWLIKPATKEKECAFYELLSKEKQTPAWYVVQWWGEKVSNLLSCLEAHASLRKLSPQSGFWLGAFANRQHAPREDLSVDGLHGTSFYKAMASTGFRILLYLDPKVENMGPATPMNRMWCDIEVAMCLDEASAVVDIGTIQNSKAIIMTRHLTEEEQESEKTAPGSGYKAKENRERAFSIDTIDKALSVAIQKAEVSELVDRANILNCIAGRDASAEVLDEHASYDKVNKRLRAMFALTCWRRIMAPSGSEDDTMKEIQSKLADALRNDVWRESLDLSLAFMVGGVEKMGLLTRCLPPDIKELNLNLTGMNLSDEHIVALASSFPSGLEELQLDLSGNTDISNVGVANFMNNIPPKLRSQSLDLKNTGVSKEFQDKSETIDGIKHAIYEESQKGNLCTSIMLLPIKEAKGRMAYTVEKSKCY